MDRREKKTNNVVVVVVVVWQGDVMMMICWPPLLDVFSISIESKWPTKEKVFIIFSVPY